MCQPAERAVGLTVVVYVTPGCAPLYRSDDGAVDAATPASSAAAAVGQRTPTTRGILDTGAWYQEYIRGCIRLLFSQRDDFPWFDSQLIKITVQSQKFTLKLFKKGTVPF